jgi:hypothetical protein
VWELALCFAYALKNLARFSKKNLARFQKNLARCCNIFQGTRHIVAEKATLLF